MPSPVAFELPAFLLGLLFGSFLNVCISRLPTHRSIATPRSHCPNCLTPIPWHDNIPLLSYLLLRARCRHCKLPIPWRYPAVELAVALWFALATRTMLTTIDRTHDFGYDATAFTPALLLHSLALAILGFLLIGLLVMDWQTHTLPDAFTLTGTALGFLLTCTQAIFLAPHEGEVLLRGRNPLTSPGSVVDKGNVVLTGPEHLVLGRLLAIVAAASILLLIRFLYAKLRHREGLGLGDAKLLALIAAFLGFWPAMLALFFGVIGCAAYALSLLARGRATASTRLPLGAFLALGGLLAATLGPPLITWYTSLL